MSESDSELSVGRPSPIPPRDSGSQRKRHLSSVDEGVLTCSTPPKTGASIIKSMERAIHDADGPISRHLNCLLCRNNVSVLKLVEPKKLCKTNSGPVHAAHTSQRTEMQRPEFETFGSPAPKMASFVSPVRGTCNTRPAMKSAKMKNPSTCHKEKSIKQGENLASTSTANKRPGFYLSPFAFGHQLSVGATFMRQITAFIHFSFPNIHAMLNIGPESFTALDHNIQESIVRLTGVNNILREVQEYLKVINEITANEEALGRPSSSLGSGHLHEKSKPGSGTEAHQLSESPQSFENTAARETVIEFNRIKPLIRDMY